MQNGKTRYPHRTQTLVAIRSRTWSFLVILSVGTLGVEGTYSAFEQFVCFS